MKELFFVNETTFEKARKKISEGDGKDIIFSSSDDELNRKILEKLKIGILLINLSGRKDFQKQRDSGFNHVMAKIAKKNQVVIGINLDEIITSGKNEKAKIFGRVMQNIRICSKNKLKMKFISPSGKFERNVYDLRAFGLILGMPTWMIAKI